MTNLGPRVESFGDRHLSKAVLVLLATFVGVVVLHVNWGRLQGYEPEWVAQALVSGHGHSQAIVINASSLAGLWIALLVFYLVKHAESMTLRVSVVLGSILGLSVLTWSSTMALVPVVALLVLWFAPALRPGLKMAAVTVVIPAVLVAPWTLRNHITFDEFVPVRTGFGHLAHIGTVGLANTTFPERVGAAVPPPWTATDPFEAVARATAREHVTRGVQWDRRALESWQLRTIAAQIGPAHHEMNEAQRDKWYLREAQAFLLTNPLLTAGLAVAKLTRFVFHGRWPLVSGLTVAVAVLVGSVLALRRRVLIAPMALAVAYTLPFAAVVPYFYRYRYPIEPVFAVLAGVAVAYTAQLALRKAVPRLESWRHHGGHAPALLGPRGSVGTELARLGRPPPLAEPEGMTGPTRSSEAR